MILLHPAASTWFTFSRTGVASPTVRRPFSVRMTTPSWVRSVISKLIRLVSPHRLHGSSGRLGGGRGHAGRALGQVHVEAASFAWLAFHVNRAAVGRYNP